MMVTIKEEAERIALGSQFDSIKSFEYNLRCWCVLAQRSCLFKKSTRSLRVVVCRYGHKIHDKSSGNENVAPTVTSSQRKKSVTGHCGELYKQEVTNVPDPYLWRVRVQWKEKTTTFDIIICNLSHTCPAFVHHWRSSAHNSGWLATTLVNQVTAHQEVKVGQLVEGFQGDYKRLTRYLPMWCGKEVARDDILGGEKESFHRILGYCHRLKSEGPRAFAEWEPYEGTQMFRRIFVCPSTCRQSFIYIRPLVGLDACFTKNQRYPIQLFLVTSLDGNNHIKILAWALTDKEDEENWSWFCLLLASATDGIELPHVSFISDCQKGLKIAVRDIFLGHVHLHCTMHLERNVKSRYGVVVEKLFKQLH